MKKIKKFKLLLSIIIIILGLLYINLLIKQNTPFLKSITILGNKIEIKPNRYVYSQLNFKNGEVKNSSNQQGVCDSLYTYEINNYYKNFNLSMSSIFHIVNGEDYGYIILKFTDPNEMNKPTKDINKQYGYYFDFNVENKIKVDELCDTSANNIE